MWCYEASDIFVHFFHHQSQDLEGWDLTGSLHLYALYLALVSDNLNTVTQ